SQYLPGRRSYPEPGTSQTLCRRRGPRREFLPVYHAGAARDHGGTWLPQHQRNGRTGRQPPTARERDTLEIRQTRLVADPVQGTGGASYRALQPGGAGPRPRGRPRLETAGSGKTRTGPAAEGLRRLPDPEYRPDRRHHPVQRDLETIPQPRLAR